MSQMYLREMVDFAQKEMTSLAYDFQNASTHFALQSACQRLFKFTGFMLHNVIYAAYESMPQAVPAAPPQVVPTTPVVPVARQVEAPQAPQPAPYAPRATAVPNLPPPPAVEQPSTSVLAQIPGTPDVPIQPGVTNVVVTPQGTRVVAASGAVTVLPPGEAVDQAAATGRPAVPEAPPGFDSIVLPPGGGMTPELQAALSRRQG